MVLHSYGSGLGPLGDKDLGLKEKSRIDQEDVNIVFEDEQPFYNVFEDTQALNDEKLLQVAAQDGEKQWTQNEDEILIDNYPQFRDLDKKLCFKMLAEMLGTKSGKDCYKRAKVLKLKESDAG